MLKKLTKPERILDELEYHTLKDPIIIGEYGRIFQDTVKHILTIESKEKRTQMAHAIINSMSILNTQAKDTYDYKHKLWDHLHIISNFKLDIDSPFPVPNPEVLVTKPERIPYHTKRIKYRYYGKLVETYLLKVSTLPDGPEKNEYIRLLGSFLKSSCKAWNDENVSDQAIIDQMNELSNEQLNLAYDGQQFSIDMARTGKSVNPLRGENETNHRYGNKNRNNNSKNRNNNRPNNNRKKY
ncbi:MAG: DUF4290 domain-containing protein [Bacteroidetes bacterium]|nr:DUF4290 domain-containing protein [Bacteroidota bacterium]